MRLTKAVINVHEKRNGRSNVQTDGFVKKSECGNARKSMLHEFLPIFGIFSNTFYKEYRTVTEKLKPQATIFMHEA